MFYELFKINHQNYLVDRNKSSRFVLYKSARPAIRSEIKMGKLQLSKAAAQVVKDDQNTNKDLLVWRCNTAAMLKEIINNNKDLGILKIPFKIFGDMLYELGEISARINDPELNSMMCRLAIYDQSDPYSPNYDPELVSNTIISGGNAKRKREAAGN